MCKAIFSIITLAIIGTILMADPPEWGFMVEPTEVIETYYDYIPCTRNGSPLQILDNGCIYWISHRREATSGTSRVILSYIESDGTVATHFYVGHSIIQEGYGGIDIDIDTQDPFFAYNKKDSGEDIYDTVLSFDTWHLLNFPGLISTPYTLFENTNWDNMPIDPPFEDDMFIHPDVHIGKAPTYDEDGKRRIYVLARNQTGHSDDGYPCENAMIAYADFDTYTIESDYLSNLDWHYLTLPIMDEWNANPVWTAPYYATAFTENGTFAIIGYRIGNIEYDEPEVFVFINDTYCEGEWEYHAINTEMEVDHPMYEDGTMWHPECEDLHFGIANTNYITAAWDGAGRLHVVLPYILKATYAGNEMIWPKLTQLRDVVFDPDTDTFQHSDLYPKSATPDDGEPFLPWDPDEDGELEYTSNFQIVMQESMPQCCFNYVYGAHYNLIQMTSEPEQGWIACVWTDELKAYRFLYEGDEDYIDWAEIPEVMIAVTGDNGNTWTDPIVMNANSYDPDGNYTPQLEEQIPRYLYVGDKIEDMGNNHGKLHIGYYDDSEFNATMNPMQGYLRYMALDIDFALQSTPEKTVEPILLGLSNFPNPFNPETTISYSLTEKGMVEIDVFNIKGQKVRTLMHDMGKTGINSVVWNGTDESGKNVSSGIYLYRLKTERQTITKKMLLLE